MPMWRLGLRSLTLKERLVPAGLEAMSRLPEMEKEAMLNRGRCGRRLSQRTTAATRRRPRRTEQRVLVKAAAQLSLVRWAMRWAWLLIGAGCLLWCMLITTN
jgi:hypothetical protein